MKTYKFISFALLVTTILTGCNKSDNDTTPQRSDTSVNFTTTITRASGTNWDAGDKIGVFMKIAGGNISTSTTLNAANVLYTTDGATFTSTTSIYYPQTGTVDFLAYYPYRTTPNPDPYVYKVDVSDQRYPTAIDLLWSNNATAVPKGSAAVGLQFEHKLSRVQINIKADGGFPAADLSSMSMTIGGMATTADFDLAVGTYSNESTVASITPIEVDPTTEFVKAFTAIVVPQQAGGSVMSFTVGTDYYTYTIPASTTFGAGRSYPYTITISKTGITVSVGSITDWTPGDIETGTATNYKVGDYYPDPNIDLSNPEEKAKIVGIVFRAKTTTLSGLVVSLSEADKMWSTEFGTTTAMDEDNGAANMRAIKTLTDWETKYPAFKWCADYGSGTPFAGKWYMPANNELSALYDTYAVNKTAFNSKLTAAGGSGTAMNGKDYWSSSQYDNDFAWFTTFGDGTTFGEGTTFDEGTTYYDYKTHPYTVRAVLAF